MTQDKRKLYFILASLVLSVGFSSNLLAATFSVSVRPYEGGYNLNYGKISPSSGQVSKELSVSITSDIGKQYRLVQSMLEPLAAMNGRALASNALRVYGLRSSNKSGTLNAEQESAVGLGRQVLYTSSQSGESDSFTLVYGLILPSDVQAGSYRGRISFTIEPIDSAVSAQTVILDILAEIDTESAIKIQVTSGGKNIVLNAGKEDYSSCDVLFEISGNLGGQYRILQIIEEQPVSIEGNPLDWTTVAFTGKEAQKGIVINEPLELSSREQVIYTSSPSGDADSFIVSYSLADLSSLGAGTYRGRIKYLLEGMSQANKRLLDVFSLEVENPRVFELIVTPEAGGELRFRDLNPAQPPRLQEVNFEIKSNIGKAYQVTQVMNSPLTSREGATLPKENFTLREASLETKGKIKYQEKKNIEEGQMVLFTSDEKGSTDKFKVIYELAAPRDVHPGDYHTNFSYSVSEI
jgi:hypothetical protein